MSTARLHPWAHQIVFEGIKLPGSMLAIDHLGKEPEISEEASIWLWRFTVCVGITKSDTSENVIRFAGEALEIAQRFRARLLREIPARFDGLFDAKVHGDWVYSLSTMIEIARRRDRCSWTASELIECADSGTNINGT